MSPPTILAVSPDETMLLSASAVPPSVLIHDFGYGINRVVDCPLGDTCSPPVVAAFRQFYHPVYPFGQLLLLGHQDGTLSLYQVGFGSGSSSRHSSILRRHSSFKPSEQSFLQYGIKAQGAMRTPTKISSIKRLHKGVMGGVAAVDFIPGYTSRAVSVGHDGRCRLVDFGQDKGRVLRT